MLNVGPGRRDLFIALAGRLTSTFGDEVALVALTLRLQGDGARPYEVALLLAAGTVPLLLLARYVGRTSRRLLVGAGLAAVATTTRLVVLLVGMVDVVLVFLVRETLRASAAWYGAAQAAWMTGMVIGTLGGGRLRTETGRTWATLGGVGVVCVALAPFALAPSVWMLMPLSILGGSANGYASVCFSTLLATRTRDANRGRVNAAIHAILGGAQGLSLLAGGALAVVLSPRVIYAVAEALGVAATIVIASRQLPRAPGEGDRTAQRTVS
jgi:MFS family permease